MSQFILSHELPASESALQLFTSLVSGKIKPGNAWNRVGYRLKFLLRALTLPHSSHLLLTNLARNERLQMILQAQPALPLKIYRPYLAANLGHQQAVEALSQHYLQLEKHLPASLFDGYLSADGVVLARLQGKNDETYRIRLMAMDQLNKEGEATLLFETEQGVLLATITFSVFHFQQQQTLFIGGIQGARPETPHEAIQLATKGCHGLFPKRLLIEALCGLAQHLEVKQILAAGNKTHIYQNWRYHHKKKAQLFADYDSFWQSLNGELTGDNYFRLPLRVERKSLDDIASKKRAEYRRRYSLLDSLDSQLDSQWPN
ncbi:VirK/YbjX family protein [Winslowiella iniecta]|uniref:Virulence factor VirK n=1 Tax=Winslowiella iniecta TaxID=1560201 RepID=A0A0L7T0Z3_9GAMM|nr:VirK/YbjX family protein [Winslowiella iniecta]KOC89003.1 hypothetical protein NG42_14075 [Winslowiella iniecta]KOC92650.1 hypothetical protein NG43_12900 [Winslowiella iniecta]